MKIALKFTKKQTVIWFHGEREVGLTDFLPGDELLGELLCKEENLPKHQRDPIYIYTVRNQRGQTGVVNAYLDQRVMAREIEETKDWAAA